MKLLQSPIDRIVSMLAPHYCISCAAEGAVMCKVCLASAGQPVEPRCAGCKKLSTGFRTCNTCRHWLDIYAVYAAAPYEGVYEQLAQAYKLDMKRPVAGVLTELLTDIEVAYPDDAVLCHVPTAPRRIRSRGFDHAKLLAKHYADVCGLPHVGLLARRSNNRQLGSSRDERFQHMLEEFYVPDAALVNGKTVVLLDDVTTTGATLAGAAKVLKAAGAKRVYAVVFASAG